MLRVLFTGGGGAGTEALWRLYKGVYELHFADAKIENIDPIVPNNHRHEIPWANQPEFIRKLKTICITYKIDLIVPGVDEELYVISKKSKEFLPTEIMLPKLNFIKIMSDKYYMIKTLEQFKLPVPLTYLLNEDYSQISFPCILKPRKGRGSRGVKIINSKHEIEIIKNKLNFNANEYVVQDKIIGQEYTVQMISNKKGNLLAIVPVKVLSKKGITIDAKVEKNINVIRACELIHKANRPIGCYNIQLFLTNDRNVLPFEINPRISTTFCLVVAANLDPINLFLSKKKIMNNSYNDGFKLKRYWNNHFIS